MAIEGLPGNEFFQRLKLFLVDKNKIDELVCMYVFMYVCMYVCTYVFMYVCMYVFDVF